MQPVPSHSALPTHRPPPTRRGRRRRTLLLAATATTGLLAATLTTVHAAAAAPGCRVDYRITNQWGGGFGAEVGITNLGDPVNGWALTWSFPAAGQQVTQAWNATVTSAGAQVTARNVDHNAAIGTGATTSFGFNGAWTGSNPVPTSFALNGTTCTGTVTPTTGPPTTPPTT
ncbi:cellulose-binding domain-containing protein, partial [Micromonospora rosaria]